MIFDFKQKSQDFYVSEKLPFELSGEGDAFYVYFEKRNITTHDVLAHMQRKLGLSRMSIGIAGLKDKKAIAKQWISIYDRALHQAGGEKVFTDTLGEIAKVIETGRHGFPLNLSVPISNEFHIKLRSNKKLGIVERQKSIEIVKGLLDNGYPNLFGDQRFGINNRNKTQGYEIMTSTTKEKFDKKDTVFKLQAYVSHVYNEFVMKRAKNRKLLDGDILTWIDSGNRVHAVYEKAEKIVRMCDVRSESKSFFFSPEGKGPAIPYDASYMMITCPVFGYNAPLSKPKTAAGIAERDHMARNKLSADTMMKYKEHRVFGLRRAMWVYPSGTRVKYIGDDLIIDFALPAGSYASIVYDSLLAKLK